MIHMGNLKQVTDYDLQILNYRNAYIKSISRNDFELAIHFIELINASLTPSFKLEDLPSFEIDQKKFNYSSKIQRSARQHCFKFMKMVEEALSLERASMYERFKNMD